MGLHRVGPDERLVVWRGARVHRVEGPGDAFTVPLLERGVLVSVRPVHVNLSLPEVAAADGWVGALAHVEWVVLQPEVASAQMERAPLAALVQELIEATFRALAARLPVGKMVEPADRAHLGRSVKKAANETALEWGIDVRAVEVPELRAIGAPAGVAPVDWQPVPAGEGEDVVDVSLRAAGADVVEVIRTLRRLTGWDLLHAKAIVEQAPYVVMHRVRRADAEEVKRALEAVGAKVELV